MNAVGSPPGLCVVIADDDEGARRLYAKLVGEAPGVSEVFEASDGAEAIRAAVEHAADVVVLDLHMPVVDGARAAEALLELDPAPAILLHSSDVDGLRECAGRLGLPTVDKLDFENLLAFIDRVVDAAAAAPPESACR